MEAIMKKLAELIDARDTFEASDHVSEDDFAPYAELVEEIEEVAAELAEAIDAQITYSVTYEVLTAEGDQEENGFEEEGETLGFEGSDILNEDDIEGYIAQKIADVLESYGATDPANNNGASWYAVDGETDPRSGETTNRAVHFKGLNPDLIAAVNAAIA